jgi:hypothetical protein
MIRYVFTTRHGIFPDFPPRATVRLVPCAVGHVFTFPVRLAPCACLSYISIHHFRDEPLDPGHPFLCFDLPDQPFNLPVGIRIIL